MECNYYNSNIGYFDRLDHVPCVIQELVFILIPERIINCYCSNYISLWRTLLIEFYRNPNHSLNITTHAIDIGLGKIEWKGKNEPETIRPEERQDSIKISFKVGIINLSPTRIA